MSPIIHYRCEKCRRDFDNITDAENCENNHLTIKSASVKGYGMYPHPYEIEVIFNNGDSKIYVAEHLQG